MDCSQPILIKGNYQIVALPPQNDLGAALEDAAAYAVLTSSGACLCQTQYLEQARLYLEDLLERDRAEQTSLQQLRTGRSSASRARAEHKAL